MWPIFGGRKRETELDEELQAHIDIEATRLEAEGLSKEEAASRVRQTFGSRALVAEQTRDSWGLRWLNGVRQDLEYAFRSGRRAPVFGAAVVLSLALGIGASTLVFSVADTVYLRPLPYPVPGELMFVAMRIFRLEMVLSPDYVAWRKDHSAFVELAAMQFHGGDPAILGDKDPVEVHVTRVSYNFIAALGVPPAMGRNFEQNEELPNGHKAALLTDALWRTHFHSRADIVGRNIALDGVTYQVIGVLPHSFVMPLEVPADILTPLPITPAISHHDRGLATWTVIGRLRPGVTQAQAFANLKLLFAASRADAPEIFRDDASVMIEPLQQRMAGNVRTLLLVLAGAVGCLLMIACANVANLLLARWSARSRELAVRAAIGARRSRIVRQLVTETALYCAAGSAAGMALTALGLRTVVYFAAGSLPRLNEVRTDGRVFVIAIGVSLLTMLLFGLLPAWRAGRVDVQTVLQHAGRPGMSGGYRASRRALVAAEVALSVVLLWGAVLLLQTLWRMQHDHLGFAPEHVMSVSIPLRNTNRANANRKALTEEMLASIRRIPGTMAVSWTECTPLTGGPMGTTFTRSDRPLPKPWDRGDTVAGCAVGPEYFQASGMRLVRGRAFADADYDHPQTLAIVNEALARRYFPGEDPIGHQVDGHQNGGWKTIIGVMADSKNQGLNQPPAPQMFLNDIALSPGSNLAFVVRYVGAEPLFTGAVRASLQATDPGLLANFESLDQAIERMSAGSRFNGMLLGSFAVMAFLMAVVGVYGVLAFAVAQRAPEIGIRMALGAGPMSVQGLVLKEGVALVAIGTALGVAMSLVAGRYLKTLLYDISATDIRTYMAVVFAIAAAAMVAAWIPARRAASLDPTVTLRDS
ncbi:MAG TPA: ABC transporter permease [Bryobacteraceae bacterium]|nr:ABC transporter permease [Bryobacteraceae bacterium]